MITRRILVTWLLFGIIGCTAIGVQVYMITGSSMALPTFLALGVLMGLVGGLARVAYEWHQGGLGAEVERWNFKRLILTTSLAVLAIAAGFARALGVHLGVYGLLIAPALVGVVISEILRRRRGTATR